MCVRPVSMQAHLTHQKDLPQREGRQKKRKEGGRANEKVGHEGKKGGGDGWKEL